MKPQCHDRTPFTLILKWRQNKRAKKSKHDKANVSKKLRFVRNLPQTLVFFLSLPGKSCEPENRRRPPAILQSISSSIMTNIIFLPISNFLVTNNKVKMLLFVANSILTLGLLCCSYFFSQVHVKGRELVGFFKQTLHSNGKKNMSK